MGRLRVLAGVYAVVVLLALPGLPWAAEDVPSGETTPTATEPVEPPAEPAPATTPEPPPVAPAVATAPAPAAAPAPAPAAAPRAVSSSAPAARTAAAGAVTIRNFAFSPATVTVDIGDTVTWTNQDTARHSATDNANGTFDTGLFGKGESGSHTFTEAGTFAYICSLHPNMKGTVKVTASSATTDDSSAATDDTSSGTDDSGVITDDSGTDTSSDNLAATGFDAAIVGLGGLGLIIAGLVLRRRTT